MIHICYRTRLKYGLLPSNIESYAQKLCTIILPFGKYSYLWPLMGIEGSQDIFQEKISGLMMILYYFCTYLDGSLTITSNTFSDYIFKLEMVFQWLQRAGLNVNAAKSNFACDKIEYLGYLLKEVASSLSLIMWWLIVLKPAQSVKKG